MDADNSDKTPAKNLVYCNRCKGGTWHERIWKSSRNEADFDEDGSINSLEFLVYVGWRCLGCEAISFEERYSNIGMTDANGENVWDSTFHPERSTYKISPKNFTSLPDKLANIYGESLKAFNAQANVLTATGLRSLIEGVCRDKSIKGRNLEEKIDGLDQILPTSIVKNLHSLRFMGNIATHDLASPPKHELRLAIEICEDLLNYLYELDYKTARLGKFTSIRMQQEKGDSNTPPKASE